MEDIKTKAINFRKKNPQLYQEIMEKYAPVFDRFVAIEMYEKGIPPPTCKICGVRVTVKKSMGNVCNAHVNYRPETQYTYERFTKEYPGEYQYWSGELSAVNDIQINCPVHGWYRQKMSSRIKGHGCQKCYHAQRVQRTFIDTEAYFKEFFNKHGDRYDYSKVYLTRAEGKIEIICKQHGSFWQAANVHKAGHGCPSCAKEEALLRIPTMLANSLKSGKTKDTKPELACKKFLEGHEISYIAQYEVNHGTYSAIYDFYLPDKNLIIEVDGEYWHSTKKQASRDKFKTMLAINAGHLILRISDSDLNFSLIFSSVETIKSNNKMLMENRKDRLRD